MSICMTSTCQFLPQPLLSIIIPVYNSAPYLRRCLDSLLDQGYDNIQVVLVNDGSKDESLSICREYERKDERFVVLDQSNQGQAVARNRGLEEAQGEYITFLDSDDFIAPHTYQLVMDDLLKHPDCEIVQFPVRCDIGSSEERDIYNQIDRIETRKEALHSFMLSRDYSWWIWHKIYKKKLMEGLRFAEGRIYEDNLFACEAMLKASKVLYTSKGSYCYYWNNSSTTHNPSPKSFVDMVFIHGKMYELLKQRGSVSIHVHMLYIIANDVYSSLRVHGVRNPIADIGYPYLRSASYIDILSPSTLSMRKKGKIIALKLLACCLNLTSKFLK